MILNMTKLELGSIIVVGGYEHGLQNRNTYEYDVHENKWETIWMESGENFKKIIASPATTLLQDGTTLLCASDYEMTEWQVLIFHPHNRSGNMVEVIHDREWRDYACRVSASMVTLHDGTVLRLGGRISRMVTAGPNGGAPVDNAMLDPYTRKWSELKLTRRMHSRMFCIVLKSGDVLITGGYDSFTLRFVSACCIYRPQTNEFYETGPLVIGRASHCGCLMDDGNVFVCGGEVTNIWDGSIMDERDCEIYTVATGTWRKAPATNPFLQRLRSSCYLLSRDRILMMGSSTCEIYNSRTESTWGIAKPPKMLNMYTTIPVYK
jgi:hypothetical protein